ncbi:hypothetical protein HBJ58_03950 [Halomonas desiderata]|uniref:hypothetical protein n=1 Tax=Billgrantia desiderata TaxID=52021 RepID=UPI00174A08F4|nr:hypothetical protein [Halomonas desiderata]MCE8012703.1 hypothetical protein [Halomonas desiderata]NIC35824.1 hypothetical protein [Halomonas desiderata]
MNFTEIGGLFITRFARLGTQQAIPEASPETGLKTSPETGLKTGPEIDLEHKVNAKETPGNPTQVPATAPKASTPELKQATGLSTSGVKYHLNQLQRTGKLRRHGPTKGGHWEVIGEDND